MNGRSLLFAPIQPGRRQALLVRQLHRSVGLGGVSWLEGLFIRAFTSGRARRLGFLPLALEWTFILSLAGALLLTASSATANNVHHWFHCDFGNPSHNCAATTFSHHQVELSDTAVPFLGRDANLLLPAPLSPYLITFPDRVPSAPTRAPPFSLFA